MTCKDLMVGALALAACVAVASTPADAQRKYDPGASDTEIKIGNIMPYSGPASAYGVIGKASEAYFRMINDEGGINGRKITFVTYDDAYSPPKTVEQARKLVENDDVLLIFQPLGTPGNTAIQKYLNTKKVPQLFVASGATKWGDPKNFPWTMGFQPNYQSEGRIFARYILEHRPQARIGVLYQNDDFGKDVLKGLKDGLGEKTALIVAEATYEISDPTADSQIVKLKTANADVFVDLTSPRFAALAIRKVAELGWKPMHFISSVSGSIGSVLQPAGLDNAKGLLSTAYTKDPSDPLWKDDPKMIKWNAFMDKYMPGANKADQGYVSSYMATQTLVEVLRRCGDDLSRANVMRQAANLRDFEVDVLLPGIKVNTSATDFFPVEQLQMRRFDGRVWELFGPVMNGEVGSPAG
ncbi:ABC transporter substrate-binding protein [Bradyrhizobium sp. RD5-C2]|uniref:ABC transporter substrate-binding protein n=1 Tax=Bradyrhizobium sp. RD5-C2 TaxID=244562 RepID=UPI001CC53FEF|nr:ABC transporter substrate-binding protein [Bradyrhizobium sp. RD5-C2]GIQ77382.1 branched-chain amino acid ABC transporter substrate-binding protein [Bradyrhizobium sp. RD5-C2]